MGTLGLEIVRRPPGGLLLFPRQGLTPVIHYEADDAFHSLYAKAQEKTQMVDSDNPLRRQRHYTLQSLLRFLPPLPGDFCELGCWRGLSAYQTAVYIQLMGKKVDLHLFDSFQGLSPLEKADREITRVRDEEKLRKQFACSEEMVKQNLNEFNFIQYHPGWIPDRFGDVAETHFRWVHVDVDLYQPIKESINFFFPRLLPQGIMLFDDYGYVQFPGAKAAVDECLSSLDKTRYFFTPLPTGQALLVKRD